MYIVPQPYKCLKCGHEFKFSPHNQHDAPVTNGDPVCPDCWDRFLRTYVGIGYCTVPWTKEGSSYDQEKAKLVKE